MVRDGFDRKCPDDNVSIHSFFLFLIQRGTLFLLVSHHSQCCELCTWETPSRNCRKNKSHGLRKKESTGEPQCPENQIIDLQNRNHLITSSFCSRTSSRGALAKFDRSESTDIAVPSNNSCRFYARRYKMTLLGDKITRMR